MNKVIKGKRYDTSTAQLLYTYEIESPNEAFKGIEQLYYKRTGEFFLFQNLEGNPPYFQPGTMKTRDITPLNSTGARKWCDDTFPGENLPLPNSADQIPKLSIGMLISADDKRRSDALRRRLDISHAEIYLKGLDTLDPDYEEDSYIDHDPY